MLYPNAPFYQYTRTHTHTRTPTIALGAPLPLASIGALGLPTFTTYGSVPLLALPTLTSSTPHTIPSVLPTASISNPAPLTLKSNPLAAFPNMEPLPEKLIEKILSWQYFELGDLLPDQLQATPSLATSKAQVMLVSQGS